MKNKKLIYILGAGRSGSTVLSTVLNDNREINSVGELHHFFSYLSNNDRCSCGVSIKKCEFWNNKLANLPEDLKNNAEKYATLCHHIEYHKAIPKHLTGTTDREKFEDYAAVQHNVLNALWQNHDSNILDSAKYIGRYLALRRVYGKKVKGIFLIRDIRGVIWSFKKKVQTRSSPAKTIVYYCLVNILAQSLVWFFPKDEVIKIRYEDIVDNPKNTFLIIGDFLEVDLTESITKIENGLEFDIPHIVGGNRMKKSNRVVLKKDDEWINKMSSSKKVLYYSLALPLMVLNRYKVFK